MTDKEHSSSQFNHQLNAIRNTIVKLGEQVKEQFHLTIESLDTRNRISMQQVRLKGYQIKFLKCEMDRKYTMILEQNQLETIDPRLILTALKISNSLYNISQLSELIIQKIEILTRQEEINHQGYPTDIAHCARLTVNMVDQAINAFSCINPDLANHISQRKMEANEEYNFIMCRLIDHMHKGSRSISIALDVLLIVKAIERIGDNAKNIAAHATTMLSGQTIQPSLSEETQQYFIPPTTSNMNFIEQQKSEGATTAVD